MAGYQLVYNSTVYPTYYSPCLAVDMDCQMRSNLVDLAIAVVSPIAFVLLFFIFMCIFLCCPACKKTKPESANAPN